MTPTRADAPERLHEARRLGGVHASDRLVQQKQRRPGGKRDRHLEQPQLAIGKRGGETPPCADSMPTNCNTSRARLDQQPFLAGDRRQAEDAPRILPRRRCRPIRTLSNTVTPGEDAGLLEGAHHAQGSAILRLGVRPISDVPR